MSRKRKMYIGIVILFMMILSACGQSTDESASEEQGGSEQQNPLVTMELENGGEVLIELYPDIAPNTVHNFISLIQEGFYDGLTFHRVIPGFMVQGGDPLGLGVGGPGYTIKGEFSSNGHQNHLKHERGILSMARSNHPDSAGSQFFIMLDRHTHLDGDYAAFGQVLEGMELLDQIADVDKDQENKPLVDQKIDKMSVETFGLTYEPPETMKIE